MLRLPWIVGSPSRQWLRARWLADRSRQALLCDRTAPIPPLRWGQVERHTHAYARCGMTSLVAALDVESGRVIGECNRRHRSVEFRAFLDTIEASVPIDLQAHVILDTYRTRKTALIRRWPPKHPCHVLWLQRRSPKLVEQQALVFDEAATDA